MRLPLLYISTFKCDYCPNQFAFRGDGSMKAQIELSWWELGVVNHRAGHVNNWIESYFKETYGQSKGK